MLLQLVGTTKCTIFVEPSLRLLPLHFVLTERKLVEAISLGRLHLIHCRRNGRRLSQLRAMQLFYPRSLSHSFLFNRCIPMDHLGNVLLVGCLLLSFPTPPVCWCIKTMDEVVLVSPYEVVLASPGRTCFSLFLLRSYFFWVRCTCFS